MKLLKALSVLVVLAGVVVLGLVVAPAVHGQSSQNDRRGRALTVLAGRGVEIGVSIRDVDASDKSPAGVVVDDVQANGPADKAGVKRADVIVEFDGEHVRSARQFGRLVQETAPGRTVKATIVRDGQRRDVQITPERDGDTALFQGNMHDYAGNLENYFGDLNWGDLNDRLGNLNDRLRNFNFDGFSYAFPQFESRGRLGVSVDELTPQLATYFGAKEGVLVSSVADDTPASRAGLKAGDVITKINGETIASRADLMRALRDIRDDGDVKIGIVRDKKESTITAKIEPRRSARRARPA